MQNPTPRPPSVPATGIALILALSASVSFAAPVPLFDGKSLDGWEGETAKVWRVVDGVIVGGSLEGNPRNEFLATRKSFKNFHLRLEYKIVGTEGFINGGVQFRSKRIADPPNEMSGYQADIGAGYSGFLYDESRRRKFLTEGDKEFVKTLEKPGEWNSYEVVASGAQILLFLNGQRTAIWVEREPGIEDTGLIALQIHGGCKAEISFRTITIDGLPDSAVPPAGEILSRFGHVQPSAPRGAFPEGKFAAGYKVPFGWGGGNTAPTPVCDGKFLFVWLGETGILAKFDLDGNRQWLRFHHPGNGGEHAIVPTHRKIATPVWSSTIS